MKRRSSTFLAAALAGSILLAACGGGQKPAAPAPAGSQPASQQPQKAEPGKKVTLTVATVNNPDMKNMESLTGEFTRATGIEVKYVVLPENDLRQKVTEDVATGAGKFDIVTIGTFDAQIWAKQKWILPLNPLFDKLPAEEKQKYDLDDIFPTIREALSYNGQLYAIPFYGESSMLYYRKDLLSAKGITLPERPTWQQVADAAKALHDPANGVAGICLRGLPGWGELLAPLNPTINTFGGRWFDEQWNPQLTTPEVKQAVSFYVNLVRNYGQPGAPSSGFTECLNLMANGKAAMWVDATVAAGFLEDPKNSKVVGKIGYAYAPTAVTPKGANWLWAWSLAIESSSKNPEAAFKFLTWATSKEYISLVGEKLGWVVAPPGTRVSTYQNEKYKKAAPFADIVQKSILSANEKDATAKPVPYTGVQYVRIPEFTGLGTEVSQNISAAIAGKMSVDEALQKSQDLALKAVTQGGYKK